MAQNKILPWAQTSTANALSDADYASAIATNGAYADGVKSGQASSHQANKTWRQATAPASGLGQFLVDNLSVDVTDSDTPATFSSRIANAILKLAQISPFNQSFAAAIGGYRKYAIVSDSSGNYWSSTADQNVTVPGDSGAKWQSLFNGYATEAWVNGTFVKSQAEGRYKLTNAVFDVGTGNPSFQDGAGVYHIVQPMGDYAVNRRDIDSGAISGGYWLRVRNVLFQSFVVPVAYDRLFVAFPLAYAVGSKPVVTGVSGATPDEWVGWLSTAVYPNGENYVTNTGITLSMPAQKNSVGGLITSGNPVSCRLNVMGVV